MHASARQLGAGTALLALVPVALYAVGQSLWAVVSLANVVLIAATLYYVFGPAESERAHASG
jgi:hypothetical protein